MGSGFKASVLAATVLLAGTAAESAWAQANPATASASRLVASDESRWGLPRAQEKSVQWSDRGRWGVNLNVREPVGRDVTTKDVEAGAFFRIRPGVKVGGAVRLDEEASRRLRERPEDRAPRVRLETKFQF